MSTIHKYAGTLAEPMRGLVPQDATGVGWASVVHEDEIAKPRAEELAAALPLFTYTDEQLPSGLHRFYAWETAAGGTAISALRFVGERQATELALGDPPPDAGAALGATIADCGPNQVFEETDLLTGDGVCIDVPPPPNPGGGGGAGGGGAGGGAGGTGGGGGGQTTPQKTPTTDGNCTGWTPDATNAQAVAIANQILDTGKPVSWADQTEYKQQINGQAWAFTMNLENGKRFVIAWRCTTGPGATPGGGGGTSSGSSTGGVVAGVLATLAAIGGGVAYLAR